MLNFIEKIIESNIDILQHDKPKIEIYHTLNTSKLQEGKVINMNAEIFYGTVIFFNKTYGFISWKKEGVVQPDLFLHYTGICADGFKTVHKNDKISFEIGTNIRGQPIAVNVKIISK